jgi:hypothetical protein
MKFIARRTTFFSVSLGALGVVAALPLQGGCGSVMNSVAADGGPTSAGTVGADSAASDSPSTQTLGFTPSNISLSGIDLSKIGDEDVSRHCTIQTGMGGFQDCFGPMAGFPSANGGLVAQSDGSKVQVIVVRSLTLEPAGHISVTGGLPLALVSLGGMTLLGSIAANASGGTAQAGGASSSKTNQKGAGPGGGPAATGTVSMPGAGAGGGSHCGKGGQGAVESTATGQPGAAAASYGAPAIVPLLGGSSGGTGAVGSGGAGGGALQLVAGGTFSLGAAGSINVGGGGGTFGGAAGQEACGGGSGGSLLIEAVVVKIAGILAANGGGGGGGGLGSVGFDATPDAIAAAGGAGKSSMGGAGAAAASIEGVNASAGTGAAGGGGGGAGRIRINSMSGSADLTAATISPDMSTSCATQGNVAL